MKPWFKHHVGAADDVKLMRIACAIGQTLERVSFVWMKAMESASVIDEHGAFSLDAFELAWKLRCPAPEIEAILEAFSAHGMVAAGIIVKWCERQYERCESAVRVQNHRRRQKEADGEGQPRLEFDSAAHYERLEAENEDADAGGERYGNVTVTHTDSQNNRISDSTTTNVVPFAPVVVVSDSVLIEKLGQALGGAAAQATIVEGLPKVRSWIAAGCDLDRDIAAALRGVRPKSELRDLGAAFVRRRVFAQRDGRLAAQKALPPELAFVAEGSAEWARRVAAGHKPGLKCDGTVGGRRVRGWHFPAGGGGAPSPAPSTQARAGDAAGEA